MLIAEIEPIGRGGVNLLEKDNADSLINEIVELPLRKPCSLFKQKGIETCMSSANKNNIIPAGEKRIEKQDVYGNGQEWYYPRPTFEDAGKGYAWIMLNYNSLSDENKDLLFSLEQRVDEKGENVGGNAIWFVSPHHEMFSDILGASKEAKTDKKAEEFKKRRIILSYNDRYPIKSVFLRMPITEETTVEEVEEFFTQFAKSFYPQVRQIESQTLENR